MDFIQNEPIAAKRTLHILLRDQLGNGVDDTGLTIKISKNGGAWAAAGGSTAVTSLASGPPGSAKIVFDVANWDTVGVLAYSVTKTGVEWTDSFMIEPNASERRLWYGLTTVGAVGSITLDATAPATTSFFAGAGRNCLAVFITGPAKGQSAFATAYTSGRALTLAPNLATSPTGGGGDVVALVPFTGQLDAATITAVNAAVLSAVATVQSDTDDIQTRLPAALTGGGNIKASVEALGTGMAAAIAAAVWDLATVGHATAGSFGELMAVLAAMSHFNTRIDQTVYTNGLLVSGRVRSFASKAAADSSDPLHSNTTDGEIYRFAITAVDDGSGKFTSYLMTRTL